MKRVIYISLIFLMAVLVMLSCEKDEKIQKPIIISATGDITSAIAKFRDLLGATLNTTPGHSSGRREINWDAVPDSFENVKLPFNFFNPVGPGSVVALQRGFTYSPAEEARISSNNFSDMESSNASQFAAFSGSKTFSAVSSNLWNVEFKVPGQDIEAAVKGFGAVFSDVDNEGSATMEYFAGDESLGIFKVPVRTTGSHSFLGVYFENKKVTAVKIKQGTATVGNAVKDISEGGMSDLIILDDFLYDEPQGL